MTSIKSVIRRASGRTSLLAATLASSRIAPDFILGHALIICGRDKWQSLLHLYQDDTVYAWVPAVEVEEFLEQCSLAENLGGRVAHPSAFSAEGWDSTGSRHVGFDSPLLIRAEQVPHRAFSATLNDILFVRVQSRCFQYPGLRRLKPR